MGAISKLVFVSFGAFIAGAAIFFVAGWFGALNEKKTKLDLINDLLRDRWSAFNVKEDMEKINFKNIRSHLQYLTSTPHVAGLERDEGLALYIKAIWESSGLDSVELNPYEILLSYPNKNNPNTIQILGGTAETFTSSYREDLVGAELDDNFIDAFLAYSPAGEVEGDIVYANYGQLEDFALLADLESEFYSNVSGRICIMRYGGLNRGNKVQNAYESGCAAAILFSDPADVASEGTDHVYPDSFWLPGSGMQRGSIKIPKGDPETPGWPSLPNVYRLEEEELSDRLPSIPAQPIGYDDAKEIFSRLSFRAPPAAWTGGANSDIPYTIGGNFSCGLGCKAIMKVNNVLERRVSSNVIGILKGDIEPDRYVLLGNHRDAWGYGTIDPNSGTAQLMEVVRILGDKVRSGKWRPRRTMVFLSWGAEEFGLIGSNEFNQDFMPKLADRAVAYINVDICMAGPIFKPSGTPTIKHKLLEASKNVANPANPGETYYTFWKNWTVAAGGTGEPTITLPSAGSDHAFFIYLNGIPVVDLTFRSDSNEFATFKRNLYPTYHTGFETFQLMDEILDPDYKYHETCAKLSLFLGRNLADSLVLDFRPEEYASLMQESIQSLEASGQMELLNRLGVVTEHWTREVDEFSGATANWRTRFEAMDAASDPLKARMVNDQMMKLDRTFLLSQGLPGRPEVRHAIISPSLFNSYGTSSFPGITDLLHGIELLDDDEKVERVKQLKMHVSDLMVVIKGAKDFLNDLALVI